MLDLNVDPSQEIMNEIRSFVLQKNYPCIAAIKSIQQNDFILSVYKYFGKAQFWRQMRQDLENFIIVQTKSNATYLTYWAVFDGPSKMSEDEFEDGLWNELSHLTSKEEKKS